MYLKYTNRSNFFVVYTNITAFEIGIKQSFLIAFWDVPITELLERKAHLYDGFMLNRSFNWLLKQVDNVVEVIF
jgi:hypothetical protein